jgi:hypothetical protein
MSEQQWGMLGSLGFTLALVVSLVFSIRQARKRNEPNQIKNPKQTAITKAVPLPEMGVTYDTVSVTGDGQNSLAPSKGLASIEQASQTGLAPEVYQQDVASRSPLQLLALNDTYRGTKIKWLVRFKELRRNPLDERVMLRFLEETTWLGITCNVDLTQYPQAEMWTANQKIWVGGTIENAAEESIHLQDVEFSDN